MSITLKVSLKDAKIIPAERLYLELLLTQDDYDNLLKIVERNHENDYIKSLYGERPEDVNFGHSIYNMSAKFRRNKSYTGDMTTKQFYRLYYVVKLLNSNEIIGTLEIYGNRQCIEFGLFIDNQKSHQRYGTEALNAAIAFLKQNSNIRTFKWECNADNAGSVGVAKNCGFVHHKDWVIYGARVASTFFLSLSDEDKKM
jgi:RimJ/RimL family protein N-acetyltransferase